MTHRPLDPRRVNVAIDASALNRDGSDHDKLVDRLLELGRTGAIKLIGVRIETKIHARRPM